MIKSTKALLLAGASALAILACAVEANAETFTMPGMFSFTASVSGEYAVELLGASGWNSTLHIVPGGSGAEVSGDIFLTAGEDLTLFVGGQGKSGVGAGGGGGNFVFHGTDVLAVAGGGGGAAAINGSETVGGPGLAGTSGGAGGERGGVGGVGGAVHRAGRRACARQFDQGNLVDQRFTSRRRIDGASGSASRRPSRVALFG
jgi:hypothetical protein